MKHFSKKHLDGKESTRLSSHSPSNTPIDAHVKSHSKTKANFAKHTQKSGVILALDQGTTSSRAIIFDNQLQPIAIAQKAIQVATPAAGYIEQDPNEIWQSQISTAQEVILKAGLLATDISAIAITNQRETTILWDKKTGKAVAPAIVWQDRRTHEWCEKLREKGHDATISQITGLRLDPYFSASKIVWLLQNNAQLRERAEKGELAFGTVDSWLLYNLTGGKHAIDITNASRTMLMDIHTGEWSDRLLELFAIPKAMLPTILPSNADFGVTQSGLFAKKIPIQAMMGDQQAALFGQGCTQAGMAKSTYGTGCFILMNTGDSLIDSNNTLISTVAWQRLHNKPLQNWLKPLRQVSGHQIQPNANNSHIQYALEGSIFMAGAIVQWLRDNLGIIKHSHDIETLANSVSSSEGVTLIPAFTGLGAPHWRADATASLHGMTRGTTKAHIARAALEAIALQAYDVLSAMQQNSPTPLTELRVDGGAATNDVLMQFQADILGVPVLRPTVTEVTAKGVALLAGQTIGLYDETTSQASWQLDKRFEPNLSDSQRHAHITRWQYYLNKTLF